MLYFWFMPSFRTLTDPFLPPERSLKRRRGERALDSPSGYCVLLMVVARNEGFHFSRKLLYTLSHEKGKLWRRRRRSRGTSSNAHTFAEATAFAAIFTQAPSTQSRDVLDLAPSNPHCTIWLLKCLIRCILLKSFLFLQSFLTILVHFRSFRDNFNHYEYTVVNYT